MSKHKKVGPRVLMGVFILVAFASIGLLSCGGGGSSTSAGRFACTGASCAVDLSGTRPLPLAATCTATSGAIMLNAGAARAVGVAPVAVFFDATATTSSATSRPFHDLEYRWDFGDPGSGTWNSGSRAGTSSRNAATGPVAAHVFEWSGGSAISVDYIVKITAIDGSTNPPATCQLQITLQNPDVVFAGTGTICFSAMGNFSDVPAGFCSVPGPIGTPGATAITTSDFAAALSNYAAPGTRLLFRGTETFTTGPTGASLKVDGPGIIGAYGTGTFKVQSTAVAPFSKVLFLSSFATPTIKDWRLTDIEIDGQSNTNLASISAIGSFDQLTLLRLNVHDIGIGINFAPDSLNTSNTSLNNPQHVWDQLAIVDSTIQTIVNINANAVFIAASRLSFLGNFLNDTTLAQHVARFQYIGEGVISDNNFQRPLNTKHALTIRAPNNIAGAVNNYAKLFASPVYTEKVYVSGNKFVGDTTDNPTQVQPTSPAEDGRIRNVILERDWYVSGAQTQTALLIQADEVTVRNEIIDLSGAKFHTGISVAGVSAAAASSNIRIYNNTIYSADANPADFFGLRLAAGVSNITVQNGLFSAPTALNPTEVSDSGAVGLLQTFNLLDTSGTLFVNPTPLVPADFKLGSGGLARDKGLATVPVFSDFFDALRPIGINVDIGATEQ